jgi:predicted transcriptional regulator
MAESKKKSFTIRIDSAIHRKLSIVASITEQQMGDIASKILDAPVEELYRKAMAQEQEQAKSEPKRKPKDA